MAPEAAADDPLLLVDRFNPQVGMIRSSDDKVFWNWQVNQNVFLEGRQSVKNLRASRMIAFDLFRNFDFIVVFVHLC